MLSVNMIARQLEDIDDVERQKYLIRRLSAIFENAISNVGKTMTNFKSDIVFSESCNIVDCIENVLSKIVFDKNITIEKNMKTTKYMLCVINTVLKVPWKTSWVMHRKQSELLIVRVER